MIAMEVRRDDSADKYIAINPGSSVAIQTNTQGFFIAQSAEEVKVYDIAFVVMKLYSCFGDKSGVLTDEFSCFIYVIKIMFSCCV